MNAPSGPQLLDILPPPPPGLWPPAPGWWVLALLLLAVLAWCGRWALQRWRRRAAVRRRLAAAQALLDAAARLDDPRARAAALSDCLRRVCLQWQPALASLSGTAWLAALDADDPARPFSTGAGRVLLTAPFQPAPDAAAVDAAQPLVRAWVLRRVQEQRP